MKKYIDILIIRIMFVLGGVVLVYYVGLEPHPIAIPIIIVIGGILGIAGIFAILYGLYGLTKTFRDIFRHFKKKKTA